MTQSTNVLRVTAAAVSLIVFLAVTLCGVQQMPTASGSDQGNRELASKDVACVQQCNAGVRTCKSGCEEGFRVCMQRVGEYFPCKEQERSCMEGCIEGHNACVARCPEKQP